MNGRTVRRDGATNDKKKTYAYAYTVGFSALRPSRSSELSSSENINIAMTVGTSPVAMQPTNQTPVCL